jgi:hypothetical protein
MAKDRQFIWKPYVSASYRSAICERRPKIFVSLCAYRRIFPLSTNEYIGQSIDATPLVRRNLNYEEAYVK